MNLNACGVQLLFLICILCDRIVINISKEQNTSIERSVGVSTLRPLLERVFVRKRRFLLNPKGGHLKVTINLSKRLLSEFPRGFNFALEQAFYYPCPTQRIDWLPKRLRKPTTTTPKPTGTTEPLFVYIPGSLIRYKAKPAMKPKKVQRIDDGPIQWVDSKYQKYAQPRNWTRWSQYEHRQWPMKSKWQTISHWKTYNNNNYTYNKWHNPNRWHRAADHFLNAARDNKQESHMHSDFPEYTTRFAHFPDLEPFEDWEHYHSHRDRRQLFFSFEGFSKILGLDMQSCILRAICDSKRFLLPPGYSMIQDIVRVIFTFPTISGLTDAYSQTMQSDYETCDRILRLKCPFNLLEFLIGPKGFL